MRIAEITALLEDKIVKRMDAAQELQEAIACAADGGAIRLSPYQAACLFKALTPKVKTKKGAFDFAWVFKATDAKGIRPFTHYAYSDGERLIATDGSRLHILHGADKPKGFYDARGDLVETGGLVYPLIDHAVPSPDAMIDYTVTPEYLIKNSVDIGGPAKYRWAYDLPSGHLVRKKYFDEAMNGRDLMTFYASWDAERAIRIDSDDTTAVIMPVRRWQK